LGGWGVVGWLGGSGAGGGTSASWRVAAIVFAMWTKTSASFERNILATSVTKTPLWIPQLFVLWGFAQLWFDLLARMIRRATDRTYEWRGADKEHADV